MNIGVITGVNLSLLSIYIMLKSPLNQFILSCEFFYLSVAGNDNM